MTSSVLYEGKLHTKCEHIQSGTVIHTDAPSDNHGLGQAFSPTDLVATALGSCMLAIIGIKATQMEMDERLIGTKAEITKVMAAEPRKIAEIHTILYFPNNNFSDKEKKIFENAALTCPVYYSLSEAMTKTVEFHWE